MPWPRRSPPCLQAHTYFVGASCVRADGLTTLERDLMLADVTRAIAALEQLIALLDAPLSREEPAGAKTFPVTKQER